jgi:hypothetical protein
MTITVQPGPLLCFWGPQGQAFDRVPLTPDAADSLAIDLLKAAREARRDMRAPCETDDKH